MARARKSHKRSEEIAKPTRNGLKAPYRYHPPGSNQYVIYADLKKGDDPVGKLLVLSFAELYSANYFTRALIGDDTYERAELLGSREAIITSAGIRISMFGHDLERILNYEPTQLESEWEDDQLQRRVAQFKYGGYERDNSSHGETDPEVDDTPGERIPRPDKKGKAKKEKKEPKPKIDKTGMVTANDIASELGVEGREVRGVLRALKLEKPAGGWAFDKKTADEIREKVKKGLKGKKK